MLPQRWKLKAAETTMLQALQYSMSFFDAEKSGALTSNDITWRGDSALTDALSGASLAGGFYDGANGKQLHVATHANALVQCQIVQRKLHVN